MLTYPWHPRQLSREALVNILGEEAADEFINNVLQGAYSLPSGFDIGNPGDEEMVTQIVKELE